MAGMSGIAGPALPTGFVTFVFTDIEGSTHALQELGGEYASLLETYCNLLRGEFGAAGGTEFGNEGDALFFVFEDASRAVAGALGSQRALASQEWPRGLDVRVRMGVHSGDASLTSDGTYVGLSLHLAARICSAANGGQVLLSGDVRGLVFGGLPEGASLADLGHHRLKDFPDRVALFQLLHPSLPRAFARLRSDAAPGNLPKEITRFVGRGEQIAQAAALLAGGVPLVCLTGPGGAGKTRLALEVAAEVVDSYPHGAWLVELGSITEGTLVAQAVASAIGLRDEPGRQLTESLVESLRTQRTLLVLDNCEHLIDPCAELVTALVRSCPAVQILATSQEALGIIGETILRVPSLELDTEAVELFVDRARLHRPDLPDRDATRRHPTCHRVGRSAHRCVDAATDRRPPRRSVPPVDGWE